LIAPNAWNLHARMGEFEYIAGSSGSEGPERSVTLLSDAVRRFSRSIELCDGYLRGYYGLKLAVEKLAELSASSKSPSSTRISAETLHRLNALATSKLTELIKRWTNEGKPASRQSEIIAAQELVARFKKGKSS